MVSRSSDSPVTETKGRKASIVTDRLRLTFHHAEHRAETAVADPDLSAVLNFKTGDIEWAAGQADLLTFLLIDLGAGRHRAIAFRIELFWILPMDRAETGDEDRDILREALLVYGVLI